MVLVLSAFSRLLRLLSHSRLCGLLRSFSNSPSTPQLMQPLSGNFRSAVWDPWLLVTQIICLQFCFYSTFAAWILLLDILTGSPKSLDQLFKLGSVYAKHLGGKKLIFLYLCNAATTAVAIWIVVTRAKLCLDFSATLHFWHLITTWVYNGQFPTSASWWLLNSLCVAISTVLSEFLCMRTEMKAIPVSLGDIADV